VLTHLSKRNKIIVMISVMFGLLLAALDQTIVVTAMPRIVQDLNGLQHLTWVFTAYLLASTVTVPIYGKLGDMYGRKKFFMGAIVIFLIGSALSGQAHSMGELIAFRALQGVGGGALLANSFAIIGDLFVPAERGRWQGLFGAVFGLASVVGPLLGGFLTDNYSWRWVFYINLPIGLVALALIASYMPTIAGRSENRKIDFFGAGLLAVSLISFLLAVTWGGTQYAWGSMQIISLFVASVIAAGAFLFAERRAQEPILPLHLFRSRVFNTSMIAIMLSAMGMFGGILYIPLFAQYVIGESATNSGTILTPMMAGLIASSIISGQVMSRTGRYKALAVGGMAIVVVAMYWLAHLSPTTTQWGLIARMAVMGLGLGMTMPVFNLAVQNAFSQKDLGVATASTQLFRNIGGTLGTAIMAGVLNNALAKNLSDVGSTTFAKLAAKTGHGFGTFNATTVQGLLSKQGQAQLHASIAHLPAVYQPVFMGALAEFLGKIRSGFAVSIAHVFWVGAGLMALALIVTLFLEEIPLRRSHEVEPEAGEIGRELAVEQGTLPAADEPAIALASTRAENVLDLRQRQ
jgi:EmrB/QacA subfamily drug resistance transporter